jgi:23S rRNA (cytosine1962-C5)-methyltransferase
MLKITLKKNEDRRIKTGHPWVFSNEIATLDGEREPGAAAELYDHNGRYIGCGHYSPRSLIAFRLLSRKPSDLDSVAFYEQLFRNALEHRRQVYPKLDTFRAVYGESDFAPGLVVDKYADYLSIQILSAGMERRTAIILEALISVFAPKGVIARNDVAVRELEGLNQQVSILYGQIPELCETEENGLRFMIDLQHGQKTGGFLDQKENHLLLAGISAGKRVLDCFCYSGSWAIHAGSFGAQSVLGLDISAKAVEQASTNASINALSDRVGFEECDVFDKLRSLSHTKEQFDIIIMDPPAFVKNRKNIAEATKGYLTVNKRAIELLAPGGYLITCSCSHHMGREAFRDMLVQASRLAKREMRLVANMAQAPDHPVLLSFPESEYLKCFMLQYV